MTYTEHHPAEFSRMRFCIDCHWCRGRIGEQRCHHPQVGFLRDKVSSEWPLCADLRGDNAACGPDADLFVQRDSPVIQCNAMDRVLRHQPPV